MKMIGLGSKLVGLAKNNKALVGGGLGAAALGGGAMAAMGGQEDFSATPRGQYGEKFYGRHETHRPAEAYNAFAEDDFIKDAFSAARDYGEFSTILGSAGLNPEEVFPQELYEQIASDPKLATEFVKDRIANHTADLQKGQDGFGEGWREKWKQDAAQQERARQYALAMQQAGR
jgi:hypothetical protein